MPVNNVNFYALEKVLEAAKRYQKISEWLGHSPLDDEDSTLDSCVFMVEQKLKKDWVLNNLGGNDELVTD